ncbi:hypothetical protein [Acidocella sp.]|uniref:hypothetical protein n=1 Tax=Acidocella sp. TaxID=50710 RepID=UPI00262668CB|nr:hypothetical protein [Acidocella sp.]
MTDLTDPEDADLSSARPQSAPPRYSRRLSDKILIAFHHACDQGDYEIAEQLLRILETMLTRRTVPPDANRRKSIESLVAAHERLWHLRHPEQAYT